MQIEYDVKKTSTNSWSLIWKRPSSKWLDFKLISLRKKSYEKLCFPIVFQFACVHLENSLKIFCDNFIKLMKITKSIKNFIRDRFEKIICPFLSHQKKTNWNLLKNHFRWEKFCILINHLIFCLMFLQTYFYRQTRRPKRNLQCDLRRYGHNICRNGRLLNSFFRSLFYDHFKISPEFHIFKIY